MSGPPGSRMRDRQPKVPELDSLVYDEVVTNNLLGGSTTDASIKENVVELFKAQKARGSVDPKLTFVASNGFPQSFKKRFNLKSHIRCGECGSADLEGVEFAPEALPKVLVELKITEACNVWNCDETGIKVAHNA